MITNNILATISSTQNPHIKYIRGLLQQARVRKKNQQTVLEGSHLIDAGLIAGVLLQQVVVSETALNHPEVVTLLAQIKQLANIPSVLVVTDALYKSMRSLGDGIDIMAVINFDRHSLPKNITTDCLVLNDIQDNGNLGTLLRTAAAVGIQHVICTQGTASVWSPKSLRAGMGAHFGLTIYENIPIDAVLVSINTPMYATSSHTQQLIYQTDLTQPLALVMGNEGQGVADSLMQQATAIALPQPYGQESLNVAVAGALCLYEMLRQRLYS